MSRKTKQSDAESTDTVEGEAHGFSRSTLLPALLSAICLWLAFRPVGLSIAAWIAPLGWLWIAYRPSPPERKGYWALWLSGCLFWLAALQGIRLAFWPLYFGWIILSLYLAVYIPIFVGLIRQLVHYWRIPFWLAAPISWAGLELTCSYVATGFGAVTLAQTQAFNPRLIQIADQVGGVGLSFIMMLCSSSLMLVIFSSYDRNWTRCITPGLISIASLSVTLGYGVWRLGQSDELAKQAPAFRALLVQENTPTMFDSDQATIASAWDRYLSQTRRGYDKNRPVDLVVWPESTFTGMLPLIEDNITDGLPPELEDIDMEFFQENISRAQREFEFKVEKLLGATPPEQSASDVDISSQPFARPAFLLGCDIWNYSSETIEKRNAALWIDRTGVISDRYAKIHRVMVGEYMPLGFALKWLADLFGFAGILPGEQVEAFELVSANQQKVLLAPNICFESALPRFVNKQVRQLTGREECPDIVVNISNDSWFRGSSIVDHHIAATVFCAVENRRPVLMAGNTGISAHFDGSGRIVGLTEKGESTHLLVEPTLDGRWGLTQSIGYPIGWLCGLVCWMIAAHALWSKYRVSATNEGAQKLDQNKATQTN